MATLDGVSGAPIAVVEFVVSQIGLEVDTS
jgi:hypothetical protein